jgi:hypothetical protein
MSNVTGSTAKFFIAGIRVETTTPIFKNVVIVNTHAPKWGAIWDWSALPCVAVYERVRMVNCSSESEGAAVTLFHWLHHSSFDHCEFQMGKGPNPVYIYLYSTECEVKIKNCRFDGPREKCIGDRFGNNTIDWSEGNRFGEGKGR